MLEHPLEFSITIALLGARRAGRVNLQSQQYIARLCGAKSICTNRAKSFHHSCTTVDIKTRECLKKTQLTSDQQASFLSYPRT